MNFYDENVNYSSQSIEEWVKKIKKKCYIYK